MRRADLKALFTNDAPNAGRQLPDPLTAHDLFARATDFVKAWRSHQPNLGAEPHVSLDWCGVPEGVQQAKVSVKFGFDDGAGKLGWTPTVPDASTSTKPAGHEFDALSPPPTPESANITFPDPVPVANLGPDIIEFADAINDTTTAYILQVGQTAQGNLAFNADRDWFGVDLQAGQTYSFAMVGTGPFNVFDPYLRLMDPTGTTQLAVDDDSLPGNNSVFTFTASSTGRYFVAAGAFADNGTGQYGISVTAGTRSSFNYQMGAGVIDADASWNSFPGGGAVVTYAFRLGPATYSVAGHNIASFTSLTATQMDAVRAALQAWSELSGVTFVEVNPGGLTDNATMLFANYTDATDGAGAFAFFPGSTANTASAGDVWLNTTSIPTGSVISPGSFAYSAIMHEIGHAIGLSHPGNYNATPGQSITYANNAQFTEDSDQYSLMSYFDEANTGAQFFGHPETPMMFDVHAIQQIYGARTTTRSDNTTYGYNSNAGGVYDFATNPIAAFTIWDAGGTDTLDVSGSTVDAIIDLNEGRFSSINNGINNIAIALGVTIENAIGGTGNDTIHGNGAGNRLGGGTGVNTLNGNGGNDTLVGGLGIDTMNGGAGTDDLVTYETSSLGVNIDLQANTASGGDAAGDTLTGIESLAGSNQNDQLFGDANANRLIGNGGADFIQGRGGNDNIQGGDGDDWLDGGTGGDTIDGGNGVLDVVAYGASPSGVNLDLQANTFSGGDAAGDVVTNVEGVSGSSFADQLFGDANANRLFGQGGADFIQGRDGNDAIDGGDGDDWLDGGAGADQIFGGNGFDVVAYGASVSAVNADLAAFTFTGGDAAGDTYSLIEGISGSSFNDQLFGDANGNRLFGQGGNDFIQGRGGNDAIDGGDGDDWLDGGAGADQIFGGNGFDVVAYGASLAAVNADMAAFTFTGGDAAGDTYSLIEGISGSSFGDQLFGDANGNRLFGQGGNDFIQGRGGNDAIDGGDGDDWLDGGAGGDQIFGGNGFDVVAYGASLAAVNADMAAFTFSGGDATGDTYSLIEGVSGSGFNDTLSGDANANRLFGQGGVDSLAGRGGNDYLDTGAGNDTLVFADNGGADTIADFDDFGDDVIQLSISGITSFAQVQAVMTQSGTDVFIDFATTDIVLVNTTLASMGTDDFTFV
jgi:serralysin